MCVGAPLSSSTGSLGEVATGRRMVVLAGLLSVATLTAEVVFAYPRATTRRGCTLTSLTFILTLAFSFGVNAIIADVLERATFPFIALAALEGVADTLLFSDHGHSSFASAP